LNIEKIASLKQEVEFLKSEFNEKEDSVLK